MHFWRWLPLLLWMGLIFIVSGTPGDEIPRFGVADFLIKKGGHAVAYAVLALLAKRATGRYDVALVITFLYAISDEIHQLFVVGRYGQPLDVLIDLLGGLFGLGVYRWWERARPRRQQRVRKGTDSS